MAQGKKDAPVVGIDAETEAEQAVLGSLLLDPYAYQKVKDTLILEDFSVPAHRGIWEAMVRVADSGAVIDTVTLSNEMGADALEVCGGVAYLVTLAARVPTTLNVEYYAHAVRKNSVERGLDRAAGLLVLGGGGGELSTRIAKAEELLGRARDRITGGVKGGAKLRKAADIRDREYGLSELMRQELPHLHWAVDGLVPAGLTLVVGKPKLGKSLLVLNLCIAVSCGGVALNAIRVEQGGVLYLALEDGWRRLQRRSLRMLEDRNTEASDRLRLRLRWPRLDQGGLELLDDWLEKSPTTRLVAIDTLQRIRAVQHGRQAFAEDYAALEGLHDLAEQREIAVIAVHHARKGDAEDPVDAVNGTSGLAAAADGVLVLERRRAENDAVLHIEQRDGEEGMKDLALSFDQPSATWRIMGDAEAYALAKWEQETLETLRGSAEPMRSAEIAEQLGLEVATVKMRLKRLLTDGKIVLIRRGLYAAAAAPAEMLSAPLAPAALEDDGDDLF